MAGSVRVDWDGFERWGEDEDYGVAIEDEPARDPVDGFVLVEKAAIYANENYRWAPEDLARFSDLWVPAVCPSPWGPALYMRDAGNVTTHRRWLRVFADYLADADWSGVITPFIYEGRWLHRGRIEGPGPLVIAMSVTQGDAPTLIPQPPHPWWPRRPWGVSPARTTVLVDAITRWVTAIGGDTVVSQGRFSAAAPDQDAAAERIGWTLTHDFTSAVSTVTHDDRALRKANLYDHGEVICTVYPGPDDWRTTLAQACDLLRATQSVLDLGFIRHTTEMPLSWADATAGNPPLPYPAIQRQIGRGWHLRDRFIPDVHGIQVLTRAHLDKIGTLTGWDVAQVAPDRYWVQAHDLEPWYAQPAPDPDVLAAARDAFAGAIATPDDITAHPEP